MIIILNADEVFSEQGICHSPVAAFDNVFYTYIHTIPDHGFRTDTKSYSWLARDVTKNQTKKLSILLSFYFHEVLQYLNTFFT